MSKSRSRASVQSRRRGKTFCGDAENVRLGITRNPDLMVRLGRKVVIMGDCWVLRGKPDTYHHVDTPLGRTHAHRYVYQEVHGVHLERSVHVHHVCETPGCIRPDHLVALEAGDHSRVHAGVVDVASVAISPPD